MSGGSHKHSRVQALARSATLSNVLSATGRGQQGPTLTPAGGRSRVLAVVWSARSAKHRSEGCVGLVRRPVARRPGRKREGVRRERERGGERWRDKGPLFVAKRPCMSQVQVSQACLALPRPDKAKS